MTGKRSLALWLVLLALLLAGCSTSDLSSPVEDTLAVSRVEVGSLYSSPLPAPTARPMGLVVLHTNDNWGETEPCG